MNVGSGFTATTEIPSGLSTGCVSSGLALAGGAVFVLSVGWGQAHAPVPDFSRRHQSVAAARSGQVRS